MDQLNQIQHKVKPTISDKAAVIIHIAAKADEADKKRAARKELLLRVLFVDSVTNSCVADVTMTQTAAENLISTLNKSLSDSQEKMKDPKMPERPTTIQSEPQTYVG